MVNPLVLKWHEQLLEEPMGLEGGAKLVTGTPLWGPVYIERFIKYCLPSMLAPRNRKALEAAGCALVMFVDEEAECQLKLTGAPMRFVRIPPEILHAYSLDGFVKYDILTAVHNLLIHKARDIGAGFHMMTADHIYSGAFFENLLRLGAIHDAMPHAPLNIDPTKAFPALDEFEWIDGSLRIAPQVLGEIGYRYMAPEWASWGMDGLPEDFSEMPAGRIDVGAHYMHIRGRDSVRIHCAHMNATWISNKRCGQVTPHLGGTVDSELPRYMAGPFYTPRLEDDMAQLSIGCMGEVHPRCSWDAFQRSFWEMVGGKDDRPRENRFLPYFMSPVHVPMPHDPRAPSEDELDARFGRMMEKLYGA